MLRTKSQNSRLYGLFTKLNISEDMKADLVMQFTGNRTKKSSDMLYNEANELINALQYDLKSIERSINELLQIQRRNIFKLFYDCGMISTEMTTQMKLEVINGYLARKSKSGKTLNELTYDQLILFNKQLQSMRRNYQEKQNKQANWN